MKGAVCYSSSDQKNMVWILPFCLDDDHLATTGALQYSTNPWMDTSPYWFCWVAPELIFCSCIQLNPLFFSSHAALFVTFFFSLLVLFSAVFQSSSIFFHVKKSVLYNPPPLFFPHHGNKAHFPQEQKPGRGTTVPNWCGHVWNWRPNMFVLFWRGGGASEAKSTLSHADAQYPPSEC